MKIGLFFSITITVLVCSVIYFSDGILSQDRAAIFFESLFLFVACFIFPYLFFDNWESKIEKEYLERGITKGRNFGISEGKIEGRGFPQKLSSAQVGNNTLFRVLNIIHEVPLKEKKESGEILETDFKSVLAILTDQKKEILFYSFLVEKNLSLETGKVLKVIEKKGKDTGSFFDFYSFEEFKPEKEFSMP